MFPANRNNRSDLREECIAAKKARYWSEAVTWLSWWRAFRGEGFKFENVVGVMYFE
jgi:hypothetical protein